MRANVIFVLLVQGITDYAIYMLDPVGRITNWNSGAERIKGYKAKDIVGMSLLISRLTDSLTI
jgi:PAS domain S-box-containing protein